MAEKYRQEVFNVLLAQLLHERGVVSAPENIVKLDDKSSRRMPDVIVDFWGLRTVIEGEVNDRMGAAELAMQATRRRVEENIALIGIAVVYPQELRELTFRALKETLASTQLQIGIVTESGETGFTSGDVDYLEGALRNTFDQLVKEDIVARAVAVIGSGVERFAGRLVTKKGDVDRAAECLGIRALPKRVTSKGKDVE
jgi:hypothetical protein